MSRQRFSSEHPGRGKVYSTLNGPLRGMPQPYISLVIPTRNDSYPSNVLEVQNKSLLILQRQLEAARLESEILVVEYNPDPSRPPLHESLRVDEGRYVTVKVISVPPEHHRRFPYSEKRVFHQTCAVNVGLRRSRGRFFVYRAADHIYSDGLIRFLSNKSLLEDCIYRCDRCDIDRAGFDAVPARRFVGGDLSGLRSACCGMPPAARGRAVLSHSSAACQRLWRLPPHVAQPVDAHRRSAPGKISDLPRLRQSRAACGLRAVPAVRRSCRRTAGSTNSTTG